MPLKILICSIDRSIVPILFTKITCCTFTTELSSMSNEVKIYFLSILDILS